MASCKAMRAGSVLASKRLAMACTKKHLSVRESLDPSYPHICQASRVLCMYCDAYITVPLMQPCSALASNMRLLQQSLIHDAISGCWLLFAQGGCVSIIERACRAVLEHAEHCIHREACLHCLLSH